MKADPGITRETEMNTQILTGVIAALGLMANLAGVGEVRAQEAPDAAAHASHHADFSSNRLHVRVDGEAGPGVRDIILIPGLSSSPKVWQSTVDHLGAGWRVHRIHIQGFAGAPVDGNAEGPVAAPVAEEIARYIAEQGLEKPAIVGHSMGGTIGLMLAARHPEAIGRLMVVDMVPFMGAMFAQPGTNPTVEAVTPMADMIHGQMLNSPEEAYRAQAATTVAAMVRNEAAEPMILADTAASDRTVSSNAYRELIVTDLRPELANITVPTEVVYVAFDFPGMTPEITDGIYRASFAGLPGVALTRIDEAAHFVFLDQPEAFNRTLDAFLAE